MITLSTLRVIQYNPSVAQAQIATCLLSLTRHVRCLLVVMLALLLVGCRVELYNDLPEDDANQMLALLMQHQIDAEKQPSSNGGIALRVERSQFISAVELLRLNGFPRRHYTTVETMFPPNQLVVSPTEERQKILYLTEQRIEGMLSQMEGVVHASVAIAPRPVDDETSESGGTTSVAVFIKYSPQVNLEAFRVQIKNLVEKAIPGVRYDQIGIMMQSAAYRVQTTSSGAEPVQERAMSQWISRYRQQVMLTLVMLTLALITLLAWRWWQKRAIMAPMR